MDTPWDQWTHLEKGKGLPVQWYLLPSEVLTVRSGMVCNLFEGPGSRQTVTLRPSPCSVMAVNEMERKCKIQLETKDSLLKYIRELRKKIHKMFKEIQKFKLSLKKFVGSPV